MLLLSTILVISIVGRSLAAPGKGSHSLVGERGHGLIKIVHALIGPFWYAYSTPELSWCPGGCFSMPGEDAMVRSADSPLFDEFEPDVQAKVPGRHFQLQGRRAYSFLSIS